MRWSYSCLGHILWPEVAFPNAFSFDNVLRWSQKKLHWNYRCLGYILRSERFAYDRDLHSGSFLSRDESPNGLRCVSATTQLIVARQRTFSTLPTPRKQLLRIENHKKTTGQFKNVAPSSETLELTVKRQQILDFT